MMATEEILSSTDASIAVDATEVRVSSFTDYAEYLKSIAKTDSTPRYQQELLRVLERKATEEATLEARTPISGVILRFGPSKCRSYDCSKLSNTKEFRRLITTCDADVDYQIIITQTIGGGEFEPIPLSLDELDALGLELGINPNFWYLYSLRRSSKSEILSLFDDFVQIGPHWLMIPNLSGTNLPRTGNVSCKSFVK